MRFTIGEITGLRPFKPWHDGKHEHKSYAAAEAQVRALRARGERDHEAALRDGDTLRIYSCREGGTRHWHVGHKREKGK